MFEKICAPAWIYCQKILPAAIDDSMSYYEFCCKLLGYINKLIDANKQLQDAIDNLYDFVNNVMNEIISRLPDIVKDQLEGWKDDGTLAELINEVLFETKEDKLFPKSNDLATNRIFRDVIIYDSSEMNYAINQGMSYTENGKFVVAYIPTGNAIRPTTDNVRLVEYSIDGDQIVRSGIFPFMHGNSICFNPNRRELYIAYCYKYTTGGNVSQNIIGIVDYDTFTQKGTFTLSHNSCGVCYDPVTKKLYCFGSQNDFWEYTINDDLTLNNTNRIFCDPGSIGTVGQSSEVYTYTDGKGQQQTLFFRITYAPNTITVYNYEGGIEKVYSPPYYSNGIYKIGECEDISHVEGSKFYMSSFSPMNNSGTMNMMQLFEIDFVKNVMSLPSTNLDGNTQDIGATVRVSNTQTSYRCDGSRSKPFRYVQEAINVAQSGYYPGVDIALTTPGDYTYARMNKIYTPVRLVTEATGAVRINGLNVYNCQDLMITNVNFGGGVYPSGNATLDFYHCQASVYGSTIEKGPAYALVIDGWSDIWVSSINLPGDLTDVFVNSSKYITSNTQWHDNVTIGNSSGKTDPNIVRLFHSDDGVNSGDITLNQTNANFTQLLWIINIDGIAFRYYTNATSNGTYSFCQPNLSDSKTNAIIYEMSVTFQNTTTVHINHARGFNITTEEWRDPAPLNSLAILDICGIT